MIADTRNGCIRIQKIAHGVA
ncbi:MAG: hypothetical protein JWN70_2763, partial [Planctomycetaceae bacterium]|nr:hypothetical protein [Planctomycetaceae bacterium]